MINEQLLREVIALLVQYQKTEHEYATMLGNEIAALRDALQELSDGKFLPILEKHRRRMQERVSQVAASDSQSYDELIRRVKAGELF